MVIVIVGREIAITGLRGIAASQGIIISASTLGKYKTIFETTSISFLILNGDYYFINFYLIGMVLLWVALIIAVVSGIVYFKKFLKLIIV
jgi:CDP-diacylglycerol--glycerol-3-phosphate 3-phosphatidyltransferase